MRRLTAFLKSSGRLGIAGVVSSVVLTGASVWEHVAGHPVRGYTAIVLACALFSMGGYLAWSKTDGELQQERALSERSGPFITMHFKNPSKNSVRSAFPGDSAPILLQNDGDSVALDVQIETISYNNYEARFDIVNAIQARATCHAMPKIERDGKPCFMRNYLVPLLESGYKDSSTEELFSEGKVPVRVSYGNMNGQKYRTTGYISYHYFHKTTDIVEQERKIVRE